MSEAGSSRAPGTTPQHEQRESSEWFHEHFGDAAGAVIDFFGGDGIDLAGKDVADIGAGDGIIDLGFALRAKPSSLVGFDIAETDVERLLSFARRESVAEELPPQLEFRKSQPCTLPAGDDSFDFAFSWSTFEHVAEPSALLREVHRVLRPYAVLMIQIWPLWHSQHGAHLWQYFPNGFEQLLRSQEELEAVVRADPGPEPDWAERLIDESRSCNRVTLDGLQGALIEAAFVTTKLELLSEAVHLPLSLARVPLSLVGISGVKLLAVAMPTPG